MADVGDCDLDDLVNPARRAVVRWLGRRGGRVLGDALLYRRGGWAAGPRRGVESQDEVPCGYPVTDPGGDFVGCSRDRRGNVQPAKGYLALRSAFGGTLLLGLEILVAADLVGTVAVAPTLDNVLILGLIILMSFSLETEIEGVVPWKRAQMSGVGGIRQASASALKSNPHP